MTGIERIAAERQRQIEVEGYTSERDDLCYPERPELAEAASCYTDIAANQILGNPLESIEPIGWPWSRSTLKISEDPVRNLEKAGALIAAEIDRLLRARNKTISIVERRAT